MILGSVIVAAGMSSRMGKFKPMMNVGSTSMVRRIILTMKSVGVDKIVLVTGNNAEELENHVKDLDIVCIRNVYYEKSQMFDSVKIGLRYLYNSCDQILFTPVDVPLFSIDTVRALIESKKKLARPVCNGKNGHPLLISKELIEQILNYNGTNGLIGALHNCKDKIQGIEVVDEGAICDADTLSSYYEILDIYNKNRDNYIV